jgi:uncharacterized protein YbjT (DUF2867 family)
MGATGTVGGAVLQALIGRGARVRALVRSSEAIEKLQRQTPGVECVQAALRDTTQVRAALDGVQSAFYVSPHEADEEALAERFIAACEAARVRLVFVGVHVPGANRLFRALARLLYGLYLPHYRPKFRIAERARTSSADPVVLMPTNYFQNDELLRTSLLEGAFLQPFERPINRVDVRDIAAAAARACLDLSLPSGAYPVVGPASLDAHACSAIWSEALGQQVRYPGHEPRRFETELARVLGAKKLDDFVASYTVIRKFTLPTRAAELAQTTELLGRPPTPYAEYAREMTLRWLHCPPAKAS